MPGTTQQPSMNRTVSKLIARVERLERRIQRINSFVPSGAYLLDFSGTGGFCAAGASEAVYGWDFTLPFDSYCIVEGSGYVEDGVSGSAWSGSMELQIDGLNEDSDGAAWNFGVGAGTIGEVPISCVCYVPLLAGSHVLTLIGVSSGTTGQTDVPAFAGHLIGLPKATTSFEQERQDFGT